MDVGLQGVVCPGWPVTVRALKICAGLFVLALNLG